MIRSRDFVPASAPPPVPLKDGHRYLARNGRVVKLVKPLLEDAPRYPWNAVIDGQPRVGGTILHYTHAGKCVPQLDQPLVDAEGWDIVDVAPASRLIEKDRKTDTLERLVKARASGVPEEVWVTKDGRHMLVGDMDEEHLRNTLRMLIRTHRRRLQLRKEMAAIDEHLQQELEEALGEDKKWGSD